MRLIRTRLFCIRLLKFRYITIVTLIIVLLYLLRTNNGDGQTSSKDTELFVIPHKTAMTSEKIHIFVPTSLKKIDWHNHTQILEDSRRVGIGEGGKPATLSKSEASLEEQLYAVNGFNGALSDKIALNRSLTDIRHPLCMKRMYIELLPSVSVVVPFHNEHWSTLLRTATTATIRSPPHLLKEVLLVDDASTKEFLGAKLDRYLAEHLPRARVIRMPRRSGLIAARLAGARAAAGDVLLFLDSHTEANVNWLPPLLEPIALDYRTVVCPYIDVVAFDTFEYRGQDEGARGAFDWELFYKRLPLLPRDIENMPDPFPSPVMAGGLFAMSRAFFWELGGYDPELDIWGGEQYELSFKIWMCGGKMVDAPCSRVGHIYRKFAPFPNPEHGDFVGKNYRRVAEVWMDEYAQHLYARRPHYLRISPGNISDRVELRRSLKCKSFRWFMTQVAFDLIAHYPPKEPKPFGSGRISPILSPELCADTGDGEEGRVLALAACRDRPQQGFVLSWHKDVKCPFNNVCWDLPEGAPRSPVRLFACHLGGGNQAWRFHVETHQFIKNGDTCLEWDVSSRALFVNPCSAASDTQKWTLEHVDFEMMKQWNAGNKAVTGPEIPDWYDT